MTFPLEKLHPWDPIGGVVYLRIVLSPEESSRIYMVSLFFGNSLSRKSDNVVVFPFAFHIAVQQPFKSLWSRLLLYDLKPSRASFALCFKSLLMTHTYIYIYCTLKNTIWWVLHSADCSQLIPSALCNTTEERRSHLQRWGCLPLHTIKLWTHNPLYPPNGQYEIHINFGGVSPKCFGYKCTISIIHSLVFSLRGRAGRNHSPVMWPVWLWHTASWTSTWG